MDTFAEMTIPDYVAFGVLIVLFVLNVVAVFADRKQRHSRFPLFDSGLRFLALLAPERRRPLPGRSAWSIKNARLD